MDYKNKNLEELIKELQGLHQENASLKASFDEHIIRQKLTEDTLFMLACAIRSISECIVITDMADNIIYVNNAFLKTYQFEEHELMGQNITKVRSSNNSPAFVKQILAATLAGGFQGEVLNLRKDGSEFLVFISTSVIRDDNGEPIALIAVTSDVTEQKLAEDALKHSEHRYRALIETAMDGFLVTDLHGRIINVNQSICRMTGYTRQEMLTMNVADLDENGSLDVVTENIQKVISSGEYEFYTRHRRKDGSLYDAQISVQYKHFDKGELIAFIHDVTQQKQGERYLAEQTEILKKTLIRSSSLIRNNEKSAAYKTITDSILEISGAKYVGLNLFDENGLDFTTVVLTGFKSKILNAANYLGYDIQNKKWKYDPMREAKIKDQVISKFNCLHELTGKVITENISILIEKTFDLGEVYVVKIAKDDKPIGDFTLIYKRGETMKNRELVELYANQVGLFFEREHAKEALAVSEKKYSIILENIQDVFFITTTDGKVLEVSPSVKYLLDISREEIIGKSILNFYANPKDRNKMIDLLMKNENLENYEVQYKTEAGKIVYGSLNVNINYNAAHQPLSISGSIRNISERKLAEVALQQSEEKFSKAFQLSPIGCIITEIETGKIIEANDSCSQMLGYTEGEITGKTTLTLNIWTSAKDREAFIDDLTKKQKVLNKETLFRKKNGEIITTLLSADLIQLVGKVYILSTFIDISERKTMIETLQESEYFFKESQKAGAIGSYKTNFDTGLWVSSEILDKIFGIDNSYVRSVQGWLDLVHPEDKDMMNNHLLENVIAKRKPFNKEYRIIRKSDNELRWVQGLGKATFDNAGNIKTLIGTIQDITDRKSTEASLKESEKNYKLIFNSTGTSNSIFDTHCVLILQNEISEKTLGLGEKCGIGLNVFEIFGEEKGKPIFERMKRVIHTGISETFETEFDLPAGKLWFRSIYNPILNEYNKVSAVQLISQDITEIKKTERDLIQAKEKAEESDRLKTAFLQNMSHEIRTPMNAIMGFAELMKDHFDDKKNLEKFANIISQRSEDLLNIINDILDIAKIESGQLSVNLEECDIKELFADLTSFYDGYKNKIGKQTINLKIETHCDGSKSKIITDKVKLKQIFINLITNGLKFTSKGEIIVGCKIDDNGKHLFYVSDTGIGIPLEKQQFIFERFAQLEHGITQNQGGTGLGLPIARGLINLLGSEICVESEPDKGSTFSFTIDYICKQETSNNIT